MIVLDTSVLSALMRHDADAMARVRAQEPGDLVLCAPVAAEIRFGLERLPSGSRRRSELEAEFERWRRVVVWSDWNEAAAAEYGEQKAILARAGTPVGDMDVIIASVALGMGGSVATRNVDDFSHITCLSVDDWRPRD